MSSQLDQPEKDLLIKLKSDFGGTHQSFKNLDHRQRGFFTILDFTKVLNA